MILFLTASTADIDQALTQAISQALGGVMMLMAIGLIIGLLFLIATVALITWVVKKVWYAGSNRAAQRQQKAWKKARKNWKKVRASKAWEEFRETGASSDADFKPIKDLTNSKDWLTRAQARQEIRFRNSMPPKQTKVSETGWTFNEETQLWEPPEHLKK